MKIYDLIIIGAGPAGLSAAVYAARYDLKTLVLGEVVGGLITQSHDICNVVSYKKISGFEFAKKMKEHVESLGVEIKGGKVESIRKAKNGFEIKTSNEKYFSEKIILALGCEKKRLGAKNEGKFLGEGISYCALCDAPFFKDKIVGVVGGGNAALTSVLLLAQFAKKVYIIYREGKFFRPEPLLVKEIENNKKIEIILNTNVVELLGKDKLEKIKLDNKKEIVIEGLFIEMGSIPRTELAEQLDIELENGYIKVDKEQKTNIKGVFAAGDVTNNIIKQAITAMAEGAIAASSAYEEIRREECVNNSK